MTKSKLSSKIEDLIRRQTECIKGQTEKIAALEAEIEILKRGLEHAGTDPILFLKSVYNNPDAPLHLQIQAASTVAKIQAGPKANVGVFLFDRLESARLAKRAAQRIDAKMLDVTPDPAA